MLRLLCVAPVYTGLPAPVWYKYIITSYLLCDVTFLQPVFCSLIIVSLVSI